MRKAARQLHRVASQQVARLLVPLGPLGAFDTGGKSHSPKTRPGQDAAHRRVGTSGKTGTDAEMPPAKEKHTKKDMPQKRGKPFLHEGSLVHFTMR